MGRFDDDDDLYDDEFEDDDDIDDDDDDELDDDSDDDDEDIYETLEYADTCQTQSREEIRADIRMYLRRYQPLFKLVRRKED